MEKYQSVFKRYEKKYILSEEQYGLLRESMNFRMKPDRYGQSKICNIYFDTPDRRLIRTSLEKPMYKEKLRLRSYGVPDESSTAFVEIKKKYKDVVYKRRADMKYSDAVGYLYNSIRPGNQNQITNEIDWFCTLYKELVPSMFIGYERIALFSSENPDFRVTFDTDITWRETDLELACGFYGKRLLCDGMRLMELKIPDAIPLWLVKELDKLDIRPASFSKYGEAYKATLSANKADFIKNNNKIITGGISCA